MVGRGGSILVVVCGLPGCGKSTVARMVATQIQASWLRTDEIRKELFPTPQYTLAESEQTYRIFFERAQAALMTGHSVVLDATFSQAAGREQARCLAGQTQSFFHMVEVTAPEALVQSRLAARQGDPSDADFAIYLTLRASFEPFTDSRHRVHNDGDLQDLRQQIEALFADCG